MIITVTFTHVIKIFLKKRKRTDAVMRRGKLTTSYTTQLIIILSIQFYIFNQVW